MIDISIFQPAASTRSGRRWTCLVIHPTCHDCGPLFRRYSKPNPKPNLALTLLTLTSPSSNLFLDDCQSPNSQFLQDRILTHWTQKVTWQDTQLLTQHHSLCSQPWLHLWWTSYLTFSNQISTISKASYYHIRQLRCIRPYLDSTTACTIVTSIVHSKLDYCNSLY